jgi:hypothetical protein
MVAKLEAKAKANGAVEMFKLRYKVNSNLWRVLLSPTLAYGMDLSREHNKM